MQHENMPQSEHELSDVDKEIIKLDAQGKSKTPRFNKLWKIKEQPKQNPQPPPETIH